jgi:pimeloyl-ACP methyl ester carboxylesterase
MSRAAAGPQIHWRAGGSGPALLLVNGWTASGLAWPRAWVRELERDHRVIRPDNRGTGYSRYAAVPFTIRDLAEDLVDVLDDAGVERATVLGLSMGGMIAQELAIRAPERVEGLVLAGTRPPGPAHGPRPGAALLWTLMRPVRREDGLDVHFRRLWSSATAPGFADRSPEVLDELVGQSVDRPTPRSLMVHQLRAAAGWGRPQRLARITAPTVIVHGELDRFADVAHGRRLAELIPGARCVELPDVGHLVPHEAPDALIDAVRELRVAEPV